MPEYIFTNLPQYVRITPRSDFSSSVVSSGAVLLFTEDGLTLTAKQPDGTFITIGGSSGPAPVGDATAGDILAGKSATVSGGSVISGTIPTVSASLAANVTSVPSGYIASAQELTVPLASSATVAGGIVTIPAGYVASAYTVSAGEPPAENVSSGAYIAEDGAHVYVSSGWEYRDADVFWGSMTVLNGGVVVNARAAADGPNGDIFVSEGGIARVPIVKGGYFNVSSGGSAVGAIVVDGELRIFDGGSAENTIILGGRLGVSGGMVSNTDILGGSAVVSSGGTAATTYIRRGGRMNVYGQVTSVTVKGVMDIYGSADYVHILSGGLMYAREGSTITNLIVDEGGDVQ